jgi:hypothetical protein
LVAVTVAEPSVPNTATRSPTVTLANVGDATPLSVNVVDALTFTVTDVLLPVETMKESVPTEVTLPTAAGGEPRD